MRDELPEMLITQVLPKLIPATNTIKTVIDLAAWLKDNAVEVAGLVEQFAAQLSRIAAGDPASIQAAGEGIRTGLQRATPAVINLVIKLAAGKVDQKIDKLTDKVRGVGDKIKDKLGGLIDKFAGAAVKRLAKEGGGSGGGQPGGRLQGAGEQGGGLDGGRGRVVPAPHGSRCVSGNSFAASHQVRISHQSTLIDTNSWSCMPASTVSSKLSLRIAKAAVIVDCTCQHGNWQVQEVDRAADGRGAGQVRVHRRGRVTACRLPCTSPASAGSGRTS